MIENRRVTPRGLYWLAIGTAALTFPLILVGGVVTSYDFGMADTIWPTPPWYLAWLAWTGQTMTRGVAFLVEHGHRQLGWIVGMLTVVFAARAWFVGGRMRWFGLAALLGVSVIGLLGGLRVHWVSRLVAIPHTVLAQGFFTYLICLGLISSRFWSRISPQRSGDADKLRRLAWITFGIVYLQILLGAIVRHLGAGPEGGGPIWLIAHVAVAFGVLVHIGLIAKAVLLGFHKCQGLRRSVELLAVLVVVQMSLGVGAWGTSSGFGPNAQESPTAVQAFFATAHLVVGALMLASAASACLLSYREVASDVIANEVGSAALEGTG